MQERKDKKTTMVRKEEVQKKWILLDASGKTLGRLSSEVAKILRGKHKTTFTPHIDNGDGVIIVNAEKVVVTGGKEASKVYLTYTGHIGGQKQTPYRQMMAKNPGYILWHAVKGMMPKTRLGKQQLRKLRIIKGDQHDHIAQQPIKVEV